MTKARDDAQELIDALLDECVGVAWVVVGDQDVARLVAARVVLATRRHWSQWREDRPVARLREEVITQAVAAASARIGEDPMPDRLVIGGGLGPQSGPREIVQVALLDVDPAGRALLASTTLQDASEREAAQRVQSARMPVESLDVIARRVETALGAARRHDSVHAIVQEAASSISSAGVRELADSLRGSQVRRRLLIGGAVAAVATVGVAAIAARMPQELATSTTTASPSSMTFWGVGGDVTTRVLDQALASLPDLPGAQADTGIPATWGLPDLGQAARLSEIGTAAGSIRALFCYGTQTRCVPVVHIPGHEPPYVALDGVIAESADPQIPIRSPRLIDDDRRRVALLLPGSLTVVEPGTGAVHRIDLGRQDVVDGGWTASGRGFMIQLSNNQWLRIDPDLGQVQPVGGAAGYGRRRIEVVGATPTLYDLDSAGVVHAQRELTGQIGQAISSSVTNTEGWTAALALTGDSDGSAGSEPVVVVYAATWDVSARTAMLFTPGDAEVSPVIGWAPGDVALIPVTVGERTLLIGWNVIDGSLWTVAHELLSPLDSPWGPVPSMSP